MNKTLAKEREAADEGPRAAGTPQDLLAIDSGRGWQPLSTWRRVPTMSRRTHKYEMVGPIVEDSGPYGIDFPKGSKQFEKAAQAALKAIKVPERQTTRDPRQVG